MSLRRQMRRILDLAARVCSGLGWRLYQSPMEQRVAPWFARNGDKTLRVEYDLTPDSVVFDMGGYEGQWTSDIFSRYCCRMHVFETVPAFANAVRHRFMHNSAVTVYEFGLAGEDGGVTITLNADGSSAFAHHEAGRVNEVQGRLVQAERFLEKGGFLSIDLMKINIEGGEYDLLEHLIATGWATRIQNIQVQFHDFVPSAAERMQAIQEQLRQTHTLTYQFEFIWENWRLKLPTDV